MKLGLGVPVHATVRLHAVHEPLWAAIRADVCSGNNVTDAGVSFDVVADAPIEGRLTPLTAPEV